MEAASAGETIRTSVPAPAGPAPLGRWHWLVSSGLGPSGSWTASRSRSSARSRRGLQKPGALGLSALSGFGRQAGTATSSGPAVGALFFGYLTDRLGPKRLFMVTLVVYLPRHRRDQRSPAASRGSGRSGSSRGRDWRGIRGDQLRDRRAEPRPGARPGRAGGQRKLLARGRRRRRVVGHPARPSNFFATNLGWRLGFGLGALLAIGIMLIRRYLPESPRWLMAHGRRTRPSRSWLRDRGDGRARNRRRELGSRTTEIEIHQRETTGFIDIGRTLFKKYPRRFVLGPGADGHPGVPLQRRVSSTSRAASPTFFGVGDSAAGSTWSRSASRTSSAP